MRTKIVLSALLLTAYAVPASAQYLHLPEPNIVDNSIPGSIHATPMPASELPQATAASNVNLDQQTGGGMVANQRYETVTGGVTGEDRAALDAAQRGKSLKLVFAATNGEYLGDVNVSIKGSAGEVSNFKADGPYNYVALPAGNYTVTAMSNGETRTQKVTVGKGQKSYVIRFSPQ